MATRFYMPTVTAGPLVDPPTAAGWEQEISLIQNGFDTRVPMYTAWQVPPGSRTTMSHLFADDSTAVVDRDLLYSVFWSMPLVAQTINAETIKGQFLCRKNQATADTRSQMRVSVINNTLTTLKELLLNFDTAPLSEEWVTSITTPANRRFPRFGPQTLTAATVEDGDRILIEVGQRKHTTAVAQTSFFRHYNAAAGDLPEDLVSTNQNLNSWIEFAQTLTFVNDNPSPSYCYILE